VIAPLILPQEVMHYFVPMAELRDLSPDSNEIEEAAISHLCQELGVILGEALGIPLEEVHAQYFQKSSESNTDMEELATLQYNEEEEYHRQLRFERELAIVDYTD
jgi:hypothetical protein